MDMHTYGLDIFLPPSLCVVVSCVMGQSVSCSSRQASRRGKESYPDLVTLPPELAVQVLSHLDATDLCLASCVNEVWSSLANVDLLWKRLVFYHCYYGYCC